jgi:hypothetical protein
MLKEMSFAGNCVGRLTVNPDFSQPKLGAVETVGSAQVCVAACVRTITSIG